MLLAGGGAPFVLVAGTGLGIAGTAEAGALLPGTVPRCVALVSSQPGERFGAVRCVGLVMIGAAVAVVLLPAVILGADGRCPGYVLLLVAAFLSAGYTIALRRSGFGPWEAAAFVSLGSVLMLAPFFLLEGGPALLGVPVQSVLVQAGFQGLASGVLAPVAFAAAVRRRDPPMPRPSEAESGRGLPCRLHPARRGAPRPDPGRGVGLRRRRRPRVAAGLVRGRSMAAPGR